MVVEVVAGRHGQRGGGRGDRPPQDRRGRHTPFLTFNYTPTTLKSPPPHRLKSLSFLTLFPVNLLPRCSLPRRSAKLVDYSTMARFVLASLFAQSVQAFNVGFAPPLARSLRASSVRMADDEFSYTPKTVFMFPGQGAQTVGMGVEVAAEVPAAAELYAKASEILGYDLLAKCKDGPKEELDSTVISQPAIFVASMAAVEKLKATEEGAATIAAADVACGLSLGEYTALAFAGAISFEDGVKITKARGEAMQAASEAASSGMVSVIGLKSDKVRLPRPEPVVPLTRGRAGVRARVRGKGLRCALGEGRALAPLRSDRTAPTHPPSSTHNACASAGGGAVQGGGRGDGRVGADCQLPVRRQLRLLGLQGGGGQGG